MITGGPVADIKPIDMTRTTIQYKLPTPLKLSDFEMGVTLGTYEAHVLLYRLHIIHNSMFKTLWKLSLRWRWGRRDCNEWSVNVGRESDRNGTYGCMVMWTLYIASYHVWKPPISSHPLEGGVTSFKEKCNVAFYVSHRFWRADVLRA